MNSLEKLAAALAGAEGFVPEDEETARMMQALQLAKPLIAGMIPDTPQALDAQLLGIVTWLFGLVSDNAALEDALAAIVEPLQTVRERVAEGSGYDAGGGLTGLEGSQA